MGSNPRRGQYWGLRPSHMRRCSQLMSLPVGYRSNILVSRSLNPLGRSGWRGRGRLQITEWPGGAVGIRNAVGADRVVSETGVDLPSDSNTATSISRRPVSPRATVFLVNFNIPQQSVGYVSWQLTQRLTPEIRTDEVSERRGSEGWRQRALRTRRRNGDR